MLGVVQASGSRCVEAFISGKRSHEVMLWCQLVWYRFKVELCCVREAAS